MPAVLAASPNPSLSARARDRGIAFGSAVSRPALRRPGYGSLINRHCDILVAENALKWRHLEPRARGYERAEADWLVGFARDKGKRLRGHCFVWNRDDRMPEWLVDHAAGLARRDYRDLTRNMWRHGAFLAREFPSITSWDAMNEAVDPGSGELRETHFTRILGDRFFDLAFRILHEKHPTAQLAYNDTMSWEASDRHRDGVLRLLERGLDRGLPIHALGIQSHIGKTLDRPRDEAGWHRFLARVRDLGLDVILTEFDCSDRNLASRNQADRDAEVAAHCKGYLDLTLSFTNVGELIVWSLGDGASYMNRKSYPRQRRRADGLPLRGHPFDADLEAKPMLHAVGAALAAAPDRRGMMRMADSGRLAGE